MHLVYYINSVCTKKTCTEIHKKISTLQSTTAMKKKTLPSVFYDMLSPKKHFVSALARLLLSEAE